MSSATRLGDVVDEGAWRAAESVVETDGGGEGQEAGCDAGSESVEGAQVVTGLKLAAGTPATAR